MYWILFRLQNQTLFVERKKIDRKTSVTPMKMKRKRIAYLLIYSCISLLSCLSVHAQDTEFWFAAPDVSQSNDDYPTRFVFTNPNTTSAAVVLVAGSLTENFSIPAQSSHVITFNDVNTRDHIETPRSFAGQPVDFGIHIVSDLRILVYYMIDGANAHQRDIFSLKGSVALGTEFITPFQKKTTNYFSHTPSPYFIKGTDEIDIVATVDGTVVTFTPTMDCVNTNLALNGGNALVASNEYSIGLNQGQTFALRKVTGGGYENTGTLSGTTISSTEPIAVTISEDCIGANGINFDLAGDQIVPVDRVGTCYVIVSGLSAKGERLDFAATEDDTKITVYYDNSGTTDYRESPLLAKNETWAIVSDTIGGGSYPLTVGGTTRTAKEVLFVLATHPVYCYQHTAAGKYDATNSYDFGSELGAAIIPSMFSISQKQIDFYASSISTTGNSNGNYIFLVFQDTMALFNYGFDFYVDNVTTSVTVVGGTIPFPTTGFAATNWKYAKIELDHGVGYAGKTISVRNDYTPFSLGYFNGVTGSASYGYLSGFSGVDFSFNNTWRCPDCGGCPIPLFTDGLCYFQFDHLET